MSAQNDLLNSLEESLGVAQEIKKALTFDNKTKNPLMLPSSLGRALQIALQIPPALEMDTSKEGCLLNLHKQLLLADFYAENFSDTLNDGIKESTKNMSKMTKELSKGIEKFEKPEATECAEKLTKEESKETPKPSKKGYKKSDNDDGEKPKKSAVQSAKEGWEKAKNIGNGIKSGVEKAMGFANSVANGTTNLLLERNAEVNSRDALQSNMVRNTGTSMEDVQMVSNLAQQREEVTTYTSAVTQMGQAQLAAHGLSAQAIMRLTPVMQDYLAGTAGIKATAEDAAAAADIIGSAMNGESSALQEAGLGVSQQQQEMLATGTEAQRLATILDIVNQKYADKAALEANTPEGKIQQIANGWGRVKETLGTQLYPYLVQIFGEIQRHMPEIQKALGMFGEAAVPFVQWLAETGIPALSGGFAWVANIISQICMLFSGQWDGISTGIMMVVYAVGLLVAGLLLYKTIAGIAAFISGVMAAKKAMLTGATLAEASAQWGANAALAACPITWIIMAIAAVIAIIVAVVLWIIKLWNTNIEFKVGIIRIWNSILGFFDQIPIFFQGIGYGIADAFSHAKVLVLTILQTMANGAIDIINGLIEMINTIPGVSIGPLEKLTFATEAALKEEKARQERANKLQQAKDNAAAKAAEREAKLQEDEKQWRAKAEEDARRAEEEKRKQEEETNKYKDWKPEENGYEQPDYSNGASRYAQEQPTPVRVEGGNLDSVGSINEDIGVSQESLDLLKESASKAIMVNLAQLTPQLKIEKIDIAETADSVKVMDAVELMLQNALSSTVLEGV